MAAPRPPRIKNPTMVCNSLLVKRKQLDAKYKPSKATAVDNRCHEASGLRAHNEVMADHAINSIHHRAPDDGAFSRRVIKPVPSKTKVAPAPANQVKVLPRSA